jgi:hypothetical protein
MTARLLAEWMSFVGWLHTAVRKDSRALALFADAEDLADEAGALFVLWEPGKLIIRP